MNERIKELAEQAGEGVVNEVFDKFMLTETSDGAELKVPAVFIEKFAELIVRECAGVCDDERDSTDSDFGKLVAEGCALKIMEHFGVEE